MTAQDCFPVYLAVLEAMVFAVILAMYGDWADSENDRKNPAIKNGKKHKK